MFLDKRLLFAHAYTEDRTLPREGVDTSAVRNQTAGWIVAELSP
jgi:hypothetical protein